MINLNANAVSIKLLMLPNRTVSRSQALVKAEGKNMLLMLINKHV